jgi:hypothetical protein
MTLFFNVIVHHENVIVHHENVIVHHENVIVHHENVIVHHENVIVDALKLRFISYLSSPKTIIKYLKHLKLLNAQQKPKLITQIARLKTKTACKGKT